MSNIEYHEGHLAINVKDNYGRSPAHCKKLETYSEQEINTAYEQCREAFWENLAPRISEKYGYGKVYSEGRSGGWLTVEFPPDLESYTDLYVDIQNILRTWESNILRAWESFIEEIRAEMEYCCNDRLIEILDAIRPEKENIS